MSVRFDVTVSLKGAIGETLLGAHTAAVCEPFRAWCLADLESHAPEWLPDGRHRATFDVRRTPHSYDVCIDGDYATWYPDVFSALQFEPHPDGSAAFDPYLVEYPIEVKTCRSSALSENQRAVMATIEQQDTRIVPLRVRVNVSELPEQFSVKPRRITHDGDSRVPDSEGDDRTVDRPGSEGGHHGPTLVAFQGDGREQERGCLKSSGETDSEV